MKKILTIITFIIVAGTVLLFSCVKDEVDDPPRTTIPFNDTVFTIGELKNLYADYGGAFTITSDASFYATCVMDEASGNIYGSSYVQDHTGGIQLNFINPGGLYLGDSVRINLNGARIDKYHELYQIGNIDVGPNILKVATQRYIQPRVVTISELQGNIDFYQSTVIKLENVVFVDSVVGTTFADSVAKESLNKDLRDCMWGNILVRTSGYANFANTPIPAGSGSLIAIASVYDADAQLVIRTYDEVIMNGDRCTAGSGGSSVYFEDFDTDWGGWTAVSEQGAQVWTRAEDLGVGNSGCLLINGFDLGYHKNTDKLISPEIDISGYNGLSLNFETAKNYDGDPLNVKLIDVTDPGNVSAIDISQYINLSQSGYAWTGSGYVNILGVFGSSENPEKIRLEFTYISTISSGSEWRIDNVLVKGQ
ncbi:MAG: DUF5689 domain-containing protein [Bacteroidales bacterium]